MYNKYLVKLWDSSSVYEMDAKEMEMTTESVIDEIDGSFYCDFEYFPLAQFCWLIKPINDIYIEVELEMDDESRKMANEMYKEAFSDDWDIIEHMEWNMQIVSKIICKYDYENNELHKYIW